jgi:hypothetical protein
MTTTETVLIAINLQPGLLVLKNRKVVGSRESVGTANLSLGFKMDRTKGGKLKGCRTSLDLWLDRGTVTTKIIGTVRTEQNESVRATQHAFLSRYVRSDVS